MALVKQVIREYWEGNNHVTETNNWFEDDDYVTPVPVAKLPAPRPRYNSSQKRNRKVENPFTVILKVIFYSGVAMWHPFAGLYLISRDRRGVFYSWFIAFIGIFILLLFVLLVALGSPSATWH